MKNNRLLFYWLPVVIWLEVIFILSSIPAANLPSMGGSETFVFWGHRTAHAGEYSILGILLIRAFTSPRKLTFGAIFLLIPAIVLAGAFDEWHQSFVPGRSSELFDVYFDTICGTFGMLAYYWAAKYFFPTHKN